MLICDICGKKLRNNGYRIDIIENPPGNRLHYHDLCKTCLKYVEKFIEIPNISYFEHGMNNKLHIGKYTATCQEVNGNIAVFCMDQYLDEIMKMNGESYETSELRKRINSKEVLSLFPEEIRSELVPFKNGDLVRIPYAEEIFSPDDIWFNMKEHFDIKQWPLMRDRKNKICFRNNEFEWGWLINKASVFVNTAHFANIDGNGFAHSNSDASLAGVRLVFQVRKDDENGKNKRSCN